MPSSIILYTTVTSITEVNGIPYWFEKRSLSFFPLTTPTLKNIEDIK